MKPLLLLFLTLPLIGQVHYVSTNFSADLWGQQDTRPATWGYTDVQTRPITFGCPTCAVKIPPGMVISLTSARVSVNANLRSATPLQFPGYKRSAGLLFGLKTTAPDGSAYCDLCADNTPLYHQVSLQSKDPANYVINTAYPGGYRLQPDGVLVQVLASFLNTLGMVHIEASYTIGFEFVKAQ